MWRVLQRRYELSRVQEDAARQQGSRRRRHKSSCWLMKVTKLSRFSSVIFSTALYPQQPLPRLLMA